MSALNQITDLGLSVSVESGNLKIAGLSGLPKEQASGVIAYAKQNKSTLIAELVGRALPHSCPLHGGPVPDSCRFHPRLFKRLVSEGVLAVDGGCPIISVCKLRKDKK